MAVPGPVTSAMSAGCHEAIRCGTAALVTNADDILDLVGRLGVDDQPSRRGESRPGDGLDGDAMRVFDALPLRRVFSLDRIAAAASLDVATAARCLGRLESLGLVASARVGKAASFASQENRVYRTEPAAGERLRKG